MARFNNRLNFSPHNTPPDTLRIPRLGPEKSGPFVYDGFMDIYRIKVKELPGRHITDWFAGMTITPLENGETMLTTPVVDQAALRGLLNHLWDFNLTVTAMERIENEK